MPTKIRLSKLMFLKLKKVGVTVRFGISEDDAQSGWRVTLNKETSSVAGSITWYSERHSSHAEKDWLRAMA